MIRFNGGCGARRILGVALSRDKILHTAYEVLATYGLADLSMRRLASELQVAPGALYYHVRSKQHLLVLLSDYILARAPDQLHASIVLLAQPMRYARVLCVAERSCFQHCTLFGSARK